MKNRQTAIALTALATTAVMLSGCAGGAGTAGPTPAASSNGEPVTGGELTVASLPAMIDPYATTSRSNWMVAASVCEGLFANGANMEVRNGLADDYTYDATTGPYVSGLSESTGS